MRTDWRLIFLLYCVGLFAAGQFAKIALTLGALEGVFPGAPVPYVVSAVSVAGILFGVTAGMMVARFGARRVLLISLAVASSMSLTQAVLPGFPVFIGLRLIEGFSHLAIVVAAPTLMAAVSAPRDVPVAMGLWGTFFGVGFAGAAVFVPMLGTPGAVYVAHGLMGVVLMAALWPLLPRGVARAAWDGQIIARHIAIYSNPRMVAPGLSFLWHTIIFLGLLTFIPQVLGAWMGPVLPLVALIGTFGAGWLARWFAPRDILIFGFLASIAVLALALALDGTLRVWPVMVAMVVIGLVPGASFANVPALNPDGADQARANGAVAQLGNIGTALSVPLFAGVVAYGFVGLAVAAMVVSAIGALAVWVIHMKVAKSG